MAGGMRLLAAAAERVEIERRLEFESLPHGWGAVLGLALALCVGWLVLWMYRHEGRVGASMRLRMVLGCVRCCALAVLVLIWFEPVIASYVTRFVESQTIVLLDTSASMDLRSVAAANQAADAGGTARRIDQAAGLLNQDASQMMHALAANNRVAVYTFGEGVDEAMLLRSARERSDRNALEVVGDAGGDADRGEGGRPFELRDLAARGSQTRAAHAVRSVLQKASGAPVAGIVMLTDGGFTEAGAVESIAAMMQGQRVPLHVVGVGDPAMPRNIRVAAISAPENAFRADPFEITAHLSAFGSESASVEVALYERRADDEDGERRVGMERIELPGDGSVRQVRFKHENESLGRWSYRVAVPVDPRELLADDNQKQAVVSVIDSRVRVLLVSGSASWEYRFLSRLLERDRTFDVSCWLQSADRRAVRDGNTPIDHLPSTREELFAYDVIVLLDPVSDELGFEWSQMAQRLVSEYGGGLLYSAARRHTPALVRDDRVRPILEILPVVLDPEADLVLNRIGHYQQQAAALTLPEAARSHPVLRPQGSDAGASPAWETLGEVYWHYPVLRGKPVADVLFQHGDPRMANQYGGHVLVATQFVGSGRTAFVGFDSTWRWRRDGEESFNAFWVRMIRFLVEGKLLGAKTRGLILTDRESYSLGSAVNVTARLLDEQFEPLQTGALAFVAMCEGAEHAGTLAPTAGRPGWYEGRFVPGRTGAHEIRLELPALGDAGPIEIRHRVQVDRPDVEMIRPQMHRDTLVELARRVDEGFYYDIDQAEVIPSRIADRSESTTVRSRPTAIWDSGWTLALLVTLLAFEWAVRKWSRLL